MFRFLKSKKDKIEDTEQQKTKDPLNNSDKKKEQKKNAFDELDKKWDHFLEKIEIRFNESLQHAEEALMENLDETDYDLGPTLRSWDAMKSQMMALSEKVDNTFDEKVEPQMLKYKKSHQLIKQIEKGRKLTDSIYNRLERYEIVIEGKICKLFYNHAIQFLNEDFKCTQCSANLEIQKDIFRIHYVSCEYCNTVNTFTPSTKIATLGGTIDVLAKYESLAEWDIMEQAIHDFHEIRCPGEDDDKTAYTKGFEKRELTEKAYWTKFLQQRMQYMSKYKETFEHDLDLKMKHFYEERKRELDF